MKFTKTNLRTFNPIGYTAFNKKNIHKIVSSSGFKHDLKNKIWKSQSLTHSQVVTIRTFSISETLFVSVIIRYLEM